MPAWQETDTETLAYIVGTELALEGTTWLGLAWLGWQSGGRDDGLPANHQPIRWLPNLARSIVDSPAAGVRRP